MHRLPRHPFLLPIGNFLGAHSHRQTIAVAMSEGTVQSGNDTTMPQDLEYITRHQEIMRLWEEEISAYSGLEAQLNGLQEQLSTKDECIIEWKTAYIQCYSEFCHFVEQNKQLQEENKQLRAEVRILSYLSKVMPTFYVINLS